MAHRVLEEPQPPLEPTAFVGREQGKQKPEPPQPPPKPEPPEPTPPIHMALFAKRPG